MTGFLWVPHSTAYQVLWWCFPEENSMWLSLNEIHEWFCLSLIIWTFSKHQGAKHQVDMLLTTVGNMCFFLEGGGECGQQGIVVAQAVIRMGHGSEKHVHLNCCLWERRGNILNPTTEKHRLPGFADVISSVSLAHFMHLPLLDSCF